VAKRDIFYWSANAGIASAIIGAIQLIVAIIPLISPAGKSEMSQARINEKSHPNISTKLDKEPEINDSGTWPLLTRYESFIGSQSAEIRPILLSVTGLALLGISIHVSILSRNKQSINNLTALIVMACYLLPAYLGYRSWGIKGLVVGFFLGSPALAMLFSLKRLNGAIVHGINGSIMCAGLSFFAMSYRGEFYETWMMAGWITGLTLGAIIGSLLLPVELLNSSQSQNDGGGA
jgi:hypothetical protein